MKILHVITSLQYGGAEKLVAEIVPLLHDNFTQEGDCGLADIDNIRPHKGEAITPMATEEQTPMCKNEGESTTIDVVAFDDSEPNFSQLLTDKGIRVTFFGKGYYNPKYLFRLSKLMRNYDIVHTHNTSPQLFAAIGSKLPGSRFKVQGTPS